MVQEDSDIELDELPLTVLRNKWIKHTRLVSEFLHYLVDYQDVPGPIPTEPVVSDSGRNWVSLSWCKPEIRGAAPVVAYRVDTWLRGGEGARWTELGVSPINSFDAFNLKSEGEYVFRITPRNRYGWGEAVKSSPIVVGRPVELPEFVKILPGQLKALRGSEVTLECEVKGEPTPVIRWYRDGVELIHGDDSRYNIGLVGFLCSMTITSLLDGDSGRYMCEATNKVGRVSTFARLLVINDVKILEADNRLKMEIQKSLESPPQFSMRLRDRRIQQTYPLRLTCQVVGSPAPNVTWTKNGEEIHNDERHMFWCEENFFTLELNKTRLEDTAVYCATAKNAHGSVSCRCNLVVDKGIRAYVAPEFYAPFEQDSIALLEGGELRLSAQIEAYPTVGVMWYRNGVRLRPSRRTTMTLDHDGRVKLTLGAVNMRDAGVYKCVATNEVGRVEATVHLAVEPKCAGSNEAPLDDSFAEPSLSAAVNSQQIPYSKEPSFLKKPRSSDAYEGDTIVIMCEVIGDPKPEVIWLRDFLKPDYYRDAPHFRRVGEGPQYRLEIPQAKLDYTGTYTVIARNCYGETKAIISLQIKFKDPQSMEHSSVSYGKVQTIPVVTRELKDLRCCDGDAATLECQVEAKPPPDIRWEKGGKLLPLGGDFTADFDGLTARLSINQVYPEDEGEYTCVAYNELGKAFTSACLVVDVPEEKENLLSQNLIRPPGLLSPDSTPKSTPRTTPCRSVSPMPRHRESVPPAGPIRIRRSKVAAPKFYAIPHNRVAEEGETVRFQCAVAGHPDPWVTWDKDGSMVTPSARITIKEKDDLRILEITEVTVEDAGLYRVRLENNVGRIEASARLDVIGHRGTSTRALRALSASPMPRLSPSFGRYLSGTPTRIGNRATFASDIRGSPTPFVKWYKDDVPVERSARVSPSWDGKTAMLEIDQVEESDQGVYKCIATNDVGQASSSAELIVLQEDDATDIDRQPPKIVTKLASLLETVEGHPVQMEFVVEGTPPFDVVWVKDGCVLPDCDDFQQYDFGDGRISLCLTDVFAEDGGEYFCEVFNPFGEDTTKCRLSVKDNSDEHLPVITFVKAPVPVISTPGQNVCFCARVQSRHASCVAQFTWSVAGQAVGNSAKYTVQQEVDVTILTIHGVEYSDAGQVECVAVTSADASCRRRQSDDGCCDQSRVGSDLVRTSCTTQLSVVAHVDATDNHGDTRMCDDSALKASCRSSANEEPAMVLRGPQDTTALVGNRVLLKATFTGHPVPEVHWLKSGRQLTSDSRTTINSEDGVSCLSIQDITTDDSGKYVVSVENCYGSDCHFASVAVEGPPDPPAGKPTVTLGIESATITWSSSPYDGGRIVKGYIVEMATSPDFAWRPIADNSHSLSLAVHDLKPGGEQHKFRVRAFNVHGASEAGQESELIQLDTQDETCPFDHRQISTEPGPEFKNKYDVLEELGKGRYGIVYKVVEKVTNQKLAAKFVRCRTAKDRDKVQDEIDIMNQLRHPKVLKLAAAFESPKEMIMLMEYISGGELFERVVADDFTLTERDCILFLRQICEGVAYMHSLNVVHLDLKPENIMCHTRTSHQIKIIDFGLAQKLKPGTPVRVLFGTPEFIAPEIINYEPIGTQSDLWSIGVITYVLLSGLSPFMGDNDAETFANITRADYDFEDEAFRAVSEDARDFIKALLVKRKEHRLTAEECFKHRWMNQYENLNHVVISTDKLKKFIIRRKWQKTGNAIRAVGRMATLSASRRNSTASSTAASPRPSVSGVILSRMSSLNEEDAPSLNTSVISESDLPSTVTDDDAASNVTTAEKTHESQPDEPNNNVLNTDTTSSSSSSSSNGDRDCDKTVRMRVCSERSDSGISDCSVIPTQQNTPLLGKKFLINEEAVCTVDSNNLINTSETNGQTADKVETELSILAGKINLKDINGNNDAPSETTTIKTNSVKEPDVQSDIVANTIKKFDALATPKSKSKSSVKDAPTAKDLLKFASPKLKAPGQRKPRPIETASPLATERTYSSSPKLTPRKVSPSRIKPTTSPVSPKKVVSTIKDIRLTPRAKEVKPDASIKPKQSNENSCTKGMEHKMATAPLGESKKLVIEKHLDTSTSFQKAAAFWNKT